MSEVDESYEIVSDVDANGWVTKVPIRRRDGEVVAQALVDLDDLPVVAAHEWRLHSDGYAYYSVSINGRQRLVMMHRLLLGLGFSDQREGDHENGDRLDNRRSNLRVVTGHENSQNMWGKTRRGVGLYRGVTQRNVGGGFQARVTHNGERLELGSYPSAETAAFVAARYRATNQRCSGDVLLSYDDVPPSMNSSRSGWKAGHWSEGWKTKQLWQGVFEALLMSSALPRPSAHITVIASLRHATRRRRDAENYLPLISKSLGDALVNGRWIQDDTPEHYRFAAVVFEDEPGTNRTEVVLFTQPREET